MKYFITILIAIAFIGCAKTPTAIDTPVTSVPYYGIVSTALVDAHINTTSDTLTFRIIPTWSNSACTTMVGKADVIIDIDSTLYCHTADSVVGKELLFAIPITSVEYWPKSMAVDVKIVYAGKEYYSSLLTTTFITTTK